MGALRRAFAPSGEADRKVIFGVTEFALRAIPVS